jgi:hypothetical protein
MNRFKALYVVFRGEPQEMDGALMVTIKDTCGNLIHLV